MDQFFKFSKMIKSGINMSSVKIKIGKKEYEVNKKSTLLELIEKNIAAAKYNIVAAKENANIIELTAPLEKDAESNGSAFQAKRG